MNGKGSTTKSVSREQEKEVNTKVRFLPFNSFSTLECLYTWYLYFSYRKVVNIVASDIFGRIYVLQYVYIQENSKETKVKNWSNDKTENRRTQLRSFMYFLTFLCFVYVSATDVCTLLLITQNFCFKCNNISHRYKKNP